MEGRFKEEGKGNHKIEKGVDKNKLVIRCIAEESKKDEFILQCKLFDAGICKTPIKMTVRRVGK